MSSVITEEQEANELLNDIVADKVKKAKVKKPYDAAYRKEKNKAYYDKNKDKILAYHKKYVNNQPKPPDQKRRGRGPAKPKVVEDEDVVLTFDLPKQNPNIKIDVGQITITVTAKKSKLTEMIIDSINTI